MQLVAAALLSLVFTGLAFAQSTVSVQHGLNGGISADDWITCCGSANTNEGGQIEIDLRDPSGDSSLVRFNIFQSEGGPVPNGATITSATLSLYKFAGPDVVVQANRLLKNWDEMQASWNNATTGVPWTTPGALGSGSDILATADGQGSIGDAVALGCNTSPSGPFPAACWLNITVTAGVQAFSSGTAQNFGWKLSQVSSSDPFGMKDFLARDFSNVAGRPMLTITYDAAPPQQGCASGTLRPYDQAPINGQAVSISSTQATTLDAKYFNCGGQNVAYHDNATGNQGGAFRTGEDVDIITSPGAANGSLVVNNFETGEWMTYSINVSAAGNYDIAVRASNRMSSTVTHHIDIGPADGSSYANKGTIAIADTGSWDTFNWYTLRAVPLTAGQQVLRIYADSQWANVDQIQLTPAASPPSGCASGTLRPYDQAPINGQAVSISSTQATTLEAKYFNCGGQNVAYHDNVAGNAGNAAFRTGEDVDIVISAGAANGSDVVNNFETGEWMTYSINVSAAGNYDIAVRASNRMGSTVTQHIDIGPADGSSYANKGMISIADTGSWDTFNWYTLPAVALTAGQQVLRLYADSQWANVDEIRLAPAGSPPPPPTGDCSAPGLSVCVRFETAETQFFNPPGDSGVVRSTSLGTFDFSAQNGVQSSGSYDSATDTSRISLVSGGHDGSMAIKLTTYPGDYNHGSGTWPGDRSDISTTAEASGGTSGQTWWWAYSILLPDDFRMPQPGEDGYTLMDWHDDSSIRNVAIAGGDMANFNLSIVILNGVPQMQIMAYGGDANDSGRQEQRQTIDPNPQKNVWYDFVQYVHWAADSTGVSKLWMRKAGEANYNLVFTRNQATLYTGANGCCNAYLKLANYHFAYGVSTSVIHDRVRGANVSNGGTWESVAIPGVPLNPAP